MLNKGFRERLHMLWAKRKKENEMVVFQPPVEIYSREDQKPENNSKKENAVAKQNKKL